MEMKNNQDWSQFLKEFPLHNLLQTGEWGALKNKYGWESMFFEESGVGAMVLFRNMPMGYTIAYIPKGPIGDPEKWAALWPAINKECKKRKAVMLKIEPDEIGEQPSDALLSKYKFVYSNQTVQPPNTMLLDISAEEDEILARMKQKTRYNIRLAKKKDVEVETINDFEIFADLLKETGERDNFGVHTSSYYQQAYDLFHPLGKCELFVASFEGTPLAAAMVFIQGTRAWYMYGASNNQHRNRMPAYLLQWEAIRWSKSQGCKTYDMVGIPDHPLEVLERDFQARQDGLWGVYRFKRGFGGEIVRSVGAWDRVYSPIIYFFYNWLLRKRNG